MQTFNYKLSKDLSGRPASLLNWKINSFPFQVNLYVDKARVVNAKSLIGLLSANFKSDSIIIFSISDEADAKQFKEKLSELDFLKEV